jgi:hypothetical protein
VLDPSAVLVSEEPVVGLQKLYIALFVGIIEVSHSGLRLARPATSKPLRVRHNERMRGCIIESRLFVLVHIQNTIAWQRHLHA